MATSPVKITREQLKSVVEKDGVRAALIFLNGLTAHRFTALYRFDDETLKNIYFYDRDYPEVESSPEIPVQASYCVFVRSTQRTFAVADASRDERVAAHPKRHELKSYCGVPLLTNKGTCSARFVILIFTRCRLIKRRSN